MPMYSELILAILVVIFLLGRFSVGHFPRLPVRVTAGCSALSSSSSLLCCFVGFDLHRRNIGWSAFGSSRRAISSTASDG